ncbi:metal ABC transporter solute-binding protein, Zn/Mn family [Geminicoccus roseus]|uniref:metal ABC transporter solute-binding protein, Zn/Mn family n=1 Tax=Geminicoccus roseus TaxID=404900 RepID=UPI0009FC8F61|nr:zinc ABC transporter substrate-binding protein [Geminicoccus roseus]
MRRHLFSLAALAVLATTSHPAPAAEPQLDAVASFSIIADFAKQVGGDRVAVVSLVGPNGDAHVYEPTPADAIAVGDADLVLVNGLQFEGFLQRLVAASGTQAPVVELTQNSDLLRDPEDDGHGHGDEHGHHHHGDYDPHAWQSVPNALVYVANIADAFCAADAAGCDGYRANARAYGERLAALDAEIRAGLAAVPADRRTIITSHDAFRYFGEAYGLAFLAPNGISTSSEASAAEVAALIEQIRQDQASAIFVENVTNAKLIERIAAETGLAIGGELYSDALSGPDGPAATYVEMMRHNMTTIRGAILGS